MVTELKVKRTRLQVKLALVDTVGLAVPAQVDVCLMEHHPVVRTPSIPNFQQVNMF